MLLLAESIGTSGDRKGAAHDRRQRVDTRRIVESDRAQLSEIVQRVRDGRLQTNIGAVAPLEDAVAAFNSTERRAGKTVIRVRPCSNAMRRSLPGAKSGPSPLKMPAAVRPS
jgi:hypothetical protein